MTNSCAFCGSAVPLTREHVFGQWISKIGLDLTPAQHSAGPLNALYREMGTQPPFRQKVKDFCATCNNGWMSQLEEAAQRVLTPLILGKVGLIALEDRGAIAMWAQKTALTSMLLSSQKQRDEGYGLPQTEYSALYERREKMRPLNRSHFWVGRYEGASGFAAVRVTPLAVRVPDIPEPKTPHGYAITIVLGELILHGVRFTVPGLQLDLRMELGMPQFWPDLAPVPWPLGQSCNGESFLQFADGGTLRTDIEDLKLRPWTPATELPPSVISDGRVKLPALWGKHTLFYPISLVREAFRGRFYAFTAECDCAIAYLIHTASTGALCKSAGTAEEISESYELILGNDTVIPEEASNFACKMLPAESTSRMT